MTDPEPEPPIRVLVAVREGIVRLALGAALDGAAGLEVAATTPDATRLVQEIRHLKPDVAVVDLDIPPANGIRACAEVKQEESPASVVILAGCAETRALVAAVEAGADAYVDMSTSLEGLADVVRRVHAGEAVIPPGMLAVLLRRLIRRHRDDDAVVDKFSRLTPRERQVFALLLEGLGNQRLAQALAVSPHTARTHVQNVLEKLEVHSRLAAVRLAIDHNLIERFPVGSQT